MATIVTRGGKGSPLTNNEVDNNFINLNTELAGKATLSSLATVATTGSYSDLVGAPTNVSAFSNDAGYITSSGSITGNATTATRLATARTISLAGDVTGSATFDGSANITITAAVADDSHAHIIGNIDGLQTALDGKAALGANSDITSMAGITGGISTPDYIDFDTAATPARATGRLWWDNADGISTLNLGMVGSDVTLQVGQETHFRIKASSAITNGQVVMLTGTVGASGALTGAPASGITADTGSYIMGVATESIALNGWGYVTQFGLVRNVDTSGGTEAWTDGQILYYDPTVSGGLTKNVPDAPNAKVEVAAVVYAHATNGSLFVRVAANPSLEQLSDVETAAASNTDLLQYNGTAGKWEHKSPALITTGNADKLTTARTISLTGDVSGSTSFDGSANVSINAVVADDSHNHIISNVDGLQTALNAKQDSATALTTSTTFGGDVSGTYNAIVVADDSHNHVISNVDGLQTALDGKLNLTGGTLTNKLTIQRAAFDVLQLNRTNSDNNVNIEFVGTSNTGYLGKVGTDLYWGVNADLNNLGYKIFHDNYHPNADKLTTARTISLTGDVSGSTSFDGSANVSITATVADDSHNHIISNVDGLQTALDGKLATPNSQEGATFRKVISQFNRWGSNVSLLGDWDEGVYGGYSTMTDGPTGMTYDPFLVMGSSTDVRSFLVVPRTASRAIAYKGSSGSGSTHTSWHYTGWTTDSTKADLSQYLSTSTSFGGDVSGTYNAIVVANDSHTHAFNNLTSKTSGTGTYQTSGDFRAPYFVDNSNASYFFTPRGTSKVGIDNSYIQIGNDQSGKAGVIGNTATYDGTNLTYRTYWAYDSYYNGSNWAALRTSLGRKWMVDMGYHVNLFRVRYYNGTVSSPWADSAWSNLFTVDSNGSVEASGDFRAPIFYDSNNTAYYTNPASSTRLNGWLSFGIAGGGASTSGRWISIEGNADGSGEGSGRMFFSEHNGTTAAMDNYGMSLAYRGGSTSIVGASGNTWTGLTQIGNGEWGMFGHDNNAAGAVIMSGNRNATYVKVHGASGVWAHQIRRWNGTRAIDLDNSVYTQFLNPSGSIKLWLGNNNYNYYNNDVHVFRDSSSNVEMTIDNGGNAIATGSHRAPIFYDSDNTGYYVNPASTSLFNAIQADIVDSSNAADPLELCYTTGSEVRIGGGGGTKPIVAGTYARPSAHTGYLDGRYGSVSSNSTVNPIYCISTSYAPTSSTALGSMYGIGYTDGGTSGVWSGGGWGMYVVDNGNVRHFLDAANGIGNATGSYRAPIFYDSNNTNFYVNPNGTSNCNDIKAENLPYAKAGSAYGTENTFTTDGGVGADNITRSMFYRDNGGQFGALGVSITHATSTAYTLQIASTSYSGADDNLSYRVQNNGTWTTGVTLLDKGSSTQNKAGVLQSNASLRAPIFYDSNNTGRYLDPASESVLNTVTFFGELNLSASGQTYVDHTGTIIFRNQSGYATSATLTTSGNFTATANVTAYSDIRVKDNVEQIGGALERLQAIRGVTYTRNDLEDKERRYAGVIAQEIEEVLPEAVFDNGDRKTVDYNATIGLLIEAIKELKAEVETLRAEAITIKHKD